MMRQVAIHFMRARLGSVMNISTEPPQSTARDSRLSINIGSGRAVEAF
jgi:hypothetical protein